ncbi:MAG: alanine dehydrogenase [Gemmatimonadota bacterium]
MTFRIGVPRETKPGENRVSMTPAGVAALARAGAVVRVQAGGGAESGFPDGEYAAAGAVVVRDAVEAWDADLVVKVKEPVPAEFVFLRARTALFTYLHLAAFPDLAEVLLRSEVTAIAYETVTEGGKLPLLRPMSEVAGILAVQVGARGLERACGGRGVLLSGVTGVAPGRVCVVGAGNAGRCAARAAVGMGAHVTILDTSAEKLAAVRREHGEKVRTEASTPEAVEAAVLAADLVISTVLIVGDKAPLIISRGLLRRMKKGAVVVDIAIDQGGTLETSRPTTHDSPYFVEEGVIHYCVSNMPAAVPRTATAALAAATIPYVLKMARSGPERAMREDAALRAGLNTYKGRITCEGVARALKRDYVPPESLLA